MTLDMYSTDFNPIIIFFMVGWFILFVLGSEACRRVTPTAAIVFWTAAPILLLPYIFETSVAKSWTWFPWAKLWSVLLGVLWAMVCRRFPDRIPRSVVGVSLYLILQLNILEAVVFDLTHAHPLNGAAGILLMLTLRGWRAVSVERGGSRDLLYDLGRGWALAYTLWNITFLYCNYFPSTGEHVAVLAAPLVIAALFGWDRWLQARGLTLGLQLLIYQVTWPIEGLRTEAWFHPIVGSTLQVASLVTVGAYVIVERVWPWRWRTTPNNQTVRAA